MKAKKINHTMNRSGNKMGRENLMIYPKKEGILMPFCSAIDFTIKLGPLPI